MLNRKLFATAICAGVLLCSSAPNALALTITGTVSGAQYLLSGSPVQVTANTVLKISFETTTPGVNLQLCAGSPSDFAAHHCATLLNDSSGPGFQFLTIVDAAGLNGKFLYVIKELGTTAPGSFSFTIE